VEGEKEADRESERERATDGEKHLVRGKRWFREN